MGHCAGVVDLAGTDIEQRAGVGDRDFGLVTVLTIRVDRLEDQQVPVVVEADPRRAIPLLREEVLDVVANLGQAHIGPYRQITKNVLAVQYDRQVS